LTFRQRRSTASRFLIPILIKHIDFGKRA